MKVNMLSLFMFCLTLLMASCEKVDDAIPQDPDVPVVEDDEGISGIDTLITSDGIQFVRTPDEHFEQLPDWPYTYQYVEIDGLRQAYAEAGPADGLKIKLGRVMPMPVRLLVLPMQVWMEHLL